MLPAPLSSIFDDHHLEWYYPIMPTNSHDCTPHKEASPEQAATAGSRSANREAIGARVLPFALFMAFIGLEEAARFLAARNFIDLQPTTLYWLYPVKAASVAALLYYYRREYQELDWSDLTRDRTWIWVCLAGLITFVLWIFMDWTVTVAGGPGGFNVNLLPEGGTRVAMTIFRVAGAVLVVPVMEELFWRSFLQRYLIDNDFQSVPLGRFTWSSLVISSLLFGLEHHLFLAGVVAGVIFSLVLYRTKSLPHCILAHAVTNLALAIYVLITGEWQLW